MLQAAGLGTGDWNIVADTLVWSPRCLALFGFAPGTSMTYQHFLDAIHPDDRERVDEAVRTALEQHEDYSVEMRTAWPDGSLHWIRATGRVYCDASGRAVRMSGVVQNIAP